jgi:hypothetical protein
MPFENFKAQGLDVRGAVEKDMGDIKDVFVHVARSSHLSTKLGFDNKKAFMQFYEQMRTIFKRKSERIRLFFGELGTLS